PNDRSGRFRDRTAWLLSGAGLVLGITAAGFAISASGLDSEADRIELNTERMRLRDAAGRRRTTALVLGIGGAALVTAGVVKFALYKRKSAPQTGSVAVVFDLTSIGLQGRF